MCSLLILSVELYTSCSCLMLQNDSDKSDQSDQLPDGDILAQPHPEKRRRKKTKQEITPTITDVLNRVSGKFDNVVNYLKTSQDASESTEDNTTTRQILEHLKAVPE